MDKDREEARADVVVMDRPTAGEGPEYYGMRKVNEQVKPVNAVLLSGVLV